MSETPDPEDLVLDDEVDVPDTDELLVEADVADVLDNRTEVPQDEEERDRDG